MHKRRCVLSIALIAMLALTGCGQKPAEAPPKEKTPDEIVSASYGAMEDLTSYGFTMKMNMAVDMLEQGAMDMQMASRAEAILKPEVLVKLDSVIDMTMGERRKSASVVHYVEGTETGLMLYQQQQGQWAKTILDDPSLLAALTGDPQEALKLYLDGMESAELLGEEKVNERDCYHIRVTLSREAVMKQISQFNSPILDTETLAAALETMEMPNGLTTVLWIDKENSQLLKESMDFSAIIRHLMLQALADQGMEEPALGDVALDIEILYGNYNGVKAFTIPEDARDA